MIWYARDAITGQWVGEQKREFTFDADGNNTLVITYFWNDTTSQCLAPIRKNSPLMPTELHLNKLLLLERCHQSVDGCYENILLLCCAESYPEIYEMSSRVYPNPAADFIVFEVSVVRESASVELYDIRGKMVLQQPLPENRKVMINHLIPGMYFYRLRENGNCIQGK